MRLQSKYEIWGYHAVELQDCICQYVTSCTVIARHHISDQPLPWWWGQQVPLTQCYAAIYTTLCHSPTGCNCNTITVLWNWRLVS